MTSKKKKKKKMQLMDRSIDRLASFIVGTRNEGRRSRGCMATTTTTASTSHRRQKARLGLRRRRSASVMLPPPPPHRRQGTSTVFHTAAPSPTVHILFFPILGSSRPLIHNGAFIIYTENSFYHLLLIVCVFFEMPTERKVSE